MNPAMNPLIYDSTLPAKYAGTINVSKVYFLKKKIHFYVYDCFPACMHFHNMYGSFPWKPVNGVQIAPWN